MSTCTYPAAVDWLVANTPAVLTAASLTCPVFDGYPDGDSDLFLVIGTTDGTPDGGNATWASLGAQQIDDTYLITCEIHASSGDTALKTVRDKVFAVYNAVNDLVRKNKSLGGTLPNQYPAIVESWRFDPIVDPETLVAGRAAVLRFAIRCTDRT